MFDWKNLWSRRFHGWIWLPLPLLCLLGLMQLGIWLGWQRPPTTREFLLHLLIALVALALAGFGLWQVGRAQQALLQALRQLVHGRLETRASTLWQGTSGELAAQLNAVARRLSEAGDRHRQGAQETGGRLRQELERLQHVNGELRRALREAQDAVQRQSERFSNLSHELRTPLTAVLGYADLLHKSGLAPEQEQHLAILDQSARDMLKMINDLLDWSRIEAGKLRLHEDHFDVLATLEDTTALLAPLAYDKNLELVRICYHDVPRRLLGDAQRLRQILTNLVSNAIKFTERGEIVIRVMREREEPGRAWLRFSVTDSGTGIDAEQQHVLFRPFQQAGRSAGGSGLGLSITRRLAELMGGSVELESEIGHGSTFSVLLPFAAPQDSSLPPPDTRLHERSIWLLEAHPTARLALVHWLEFWGLRVSTYEHPGALQRALAEARTNTRPAVIVLGARAAEAIEPGFMQQLRDWGRHAPVLVLLSSVSLDLQSQVRAGGAAACLAKSAGHEALQAELLRLTGAAQASQPLIGQHVLIADNNLPNRRYISALCQELGLSTHEAADGAQALRLWDEVRPQFVLLDARMPVMDGPECARAIRKHEGGDPGANARRCRIYAISAHLEPEERRHFLDAGADGILLKPFDGRQLSQLLAAGATQALPAVSTLLGRDPSMLQLLLQELPEQFGELEVAMGSGDPATARAAAHQLHGTASFYHLGALKEACAVLERELAGQALPAHCGLELNSVRGNLHSTLGDIRNRLAAQQA